MNIENEVKSILRSGFNIAGKVEAINRIANFKDEHIVMAIRVKLENENDKYSKIYKELIRLDKHGRDEQKG